MGSALERQYAMLFDLGRPDVFSGGDLGLRHGIRIAYGMEDLRRPRGPSRSPSAGALTGVGVLVLGRPQRIAPSLSTLFTR